MARTTTSYPFRSVNEGIREESTWVREGRGGLEEEELQGPQAARLQVSVLALANVGQEKEEKSGQDIHHAASTKPEPHGALPVAGEVNAPPNAGRSINGRPVK